MAYTRITNTRNGAAAIRYAFEEPSHKKGMDRVLASSGSNLDPKFAMQQMRDVWKAHGKNDGNTVQMYRVIQSFGLDELDPNNPDDVQRANEIGQALASELYPDKQSLIVTQADGKGGKLHNHVLVNSVSFTDGKSLRGYRKEHAAVAEKTDEILVRYGMKPLDTENTRVKRTTQEKRLAEQGKYTWKDDLRGRIDDLLKDTSVTSRGVFIERLRDDFGVEASYTDKRKYITYRFEDADGTPRRSRDNKLGTDYGKDALAEQFETNKELQKAEEQRRKEQENSFSFDFDFEAELEAMMPKAPRQRVKSADTADAIDGIEARIEARRLKKQIDGAHQDGLIENAHVDALRENERLNAERIEREEKERQEAEAERQRELERQAEQERRLQAEQQAEQQRIAMETARQRVWESQGWGGTPRGHAGAVLTDEFVMRYMHNEQSMQGETIKGFDGKARPLTAIDVYHRTRLQLQEEAQEERHEEAVQIVEDAGPEM